MQQAEGTTHTAVIPLEVAMTGVSKRFRLEDGGSIEALHGLDLHVPAGSFVSILGPSGSGKSTILNLMAGLERADAGLVQITAGGNTAVGPHSVGYMPQRDLLLPWKNALDNAAVSLEVSGLSQGEARRRVLPLFGEFGLSGFAGSYPWQLSGGMRQRVSFLRSAVLERGLMLLDEPFGALDALTRASMHEWLIKAAERIGSTFVLVTHDVEEAILLSDVVYVLSPRPGRIVGSVRVELERARSLATLDEGRFAEYRRTLLGLLRASGGLLSAGTGGGA